MAMVKLIEPQDVGELALIKSLLDGNGIAYFVQNEHLGSLLPGCPSLPAPSWCRSGISTGPGRSWAGLRPRLVPKRPDERNPRRPSFGIPAADEEALFEVEVPMLDDGRAFPVLVDPLFAP